ncbi:hypothetical protein [Corallococcus interemptor]|nr:hypothetical protein [Corallococcus interemptor]
MLMNSVVMVALLAAAPAPKFQPLTWKVTGTDVTFEMSSKDLRALRDGKEVFGLQSRKKDFLASVTEGVDATQDTSGWEAAQSFTVLSVVGPYVSHEESNGGYTGGGYAAEMCRGNMYVVGLLLPIPASLKPALERANTRQEGFLMKDAKAVKAPSVSFQWEGAEAKKKP